MTDKCADIQRLFIYRSFILLLLLFLRAAHSQQVNPFALPDIDFEPEDTDDSVSFPTNEDEETTSFHGGIGSISDFMCQQYAKIFKQTVQVIPLVTNPKPVSVSVDSCANSVPLIVGGEEARPGEFPHMAALGYVDFSAGRIRNPEWNCGGTLISEQFVLTAAHCIRQSRSGVLTRIRLGGNTRLSQPAVDEVGVAETIIHPEYRPPAKYNDIALVRLSRPVKLSRRIVPACLADAKAIQAARRGIATGWGVTEYAGQKSDALMKVTLSIVSNEECELRYNKGLMRHLPRGMIPSMMCAGERKGGKDACQGDSGGPFQIARTDGSCLYNILGVTSFGKSCASAEIPGVYTRVSEYIRWIEPIVWPRS